MKDSVHFGNRKINYSVVRSARRKKTIALLIEPSGKVVLRAPLNTPGSKLSDIVRSKAEWIIRKQRSLSETLYPAEKGYVSGESFPYMGRHIRLEIIDSPEQMEPVVRMNRDRLEVYFYRTNRDGEYSEEIKLAITRWYREQAAREIPERVKIYSEKMGLTDVVALIRNQEKRWGSCNAKGVIRLNWRIIMMPMSILDYVVVHELCHIRHRNHLKEFWKYMGMIMPDYELRKERLRVECAGWQL